MKPPRPTLQEIPYFQNSAECFLRIARRPWGVILDSCHPASRAGRYDILAAEPTVTLTTRGPLTEIRTPEGIVQSEEDPFLLVRRCLGERRPPPSGPIPFGGGAIGYFSYDLGRRIERLPSIARADIPMPDMAVGIYDRVVVVDHQERRAWLSSSGGGAATGMDDWPAALCPTPCAQPAAFATSFQILTPVRAEIEKAAYAEAFHRIKRYIRAGDCYQVNLTQRFSAAAVGDPWDAYLRLRDLNPAPFSAFLRLPEGAVLSSSPERFLKISPDGQVETKPVKGTRRRDPDPARDRALAEELAASPKDRAENVMIVDLLRNDLGKTCQIGSVRVPLLFAVESFARVHHLVSTVIGTLAPGVHPLDLLRGCFPGGSITGAPKVRAMEIIEELESHRRGIYCGAIGYIGYDGAMDTNIAIRTLVHVNERLYCWAGGGIVMDSALEAEYQESLDKAAAMIDLFLRAEAERVSG